LLEKLARVNSQNTHLHNDSDLTQQHLKINKYFTDIQTRKQLLHKCNTSLLQTTSAICIYLNFCTHSLDFANHHNKTYKSIAKEWKTPNTN